MPYFGAAANNLSISSLLAGIAGESNEATGCANSFTKFSNPAGVTNTSMRAGSRVLFLKLCVMPRGPWMNVPGLADPCHRVCNGGASFHHRPESRARLPKQKRIRLHESECAAAARCLARRESHEACRRLLFADSQPDCDKHLPPQRRRCLRRTRGELFLCCQA